MGDDGVIKPETFLQGLSPGILGPMSDMSQLDRCTHVYENWRHSANRLANQPNGVRRASYIDIMRLSSCYDSFWAKCLLMGTWSPYANPVQFPSNKHQAFVGWPTADTFASDGHAGEFIFVVHVYGGRPNGEHGN